jgi:hypothetical protein
MACVLLADGGVVDVAEEDGLAGLEFWVSAKLLVMGSQEQIHTAYAMRSPFASHESCVGWPRDVAGAAARIFSISIDIAGLG